MSPNFVHAQWLQSFQQDGRREKPDLPARSERESAGGTSSPGAGGRAETQTAWSSGRCRGKGSSHSHSCSSSHPPLSGVGTCWHGWGNIACSLPINKVQHDTRGAKDQQLTVACMQYCIISTQPGFKYTPRGHDVFQRFAFN